jgi:hypothetical protein
MRCAARDEANGCASAVEKSKYIEAGLDVSRGFRWLLAVGDNDSTSVACVLVLSLRTALSDPSAWSHLSAVLDARR